MMQSRCSKTGTYSVISSGSPSSSSSGSGVRSVGVPAGFGDFAPAERPPPTAAAMGVSVAPDTPEAAEGTGVAGVERVMGVGAGVEGAGGDGVAAATLRGKSAKACALGQGGRDESDRVL